MSMMKKTATLASWAAGLAGPENMLDQLSDRMSEYMLGRMPEYVYIYIYVCVCQIEGWIQCQND